MEAKEILALDVGLKHTGLARASNVARLAEPLMSVPTDDVVATLKKYLLAHPVEAIAVGLARNLNHEETKQTTWIRQWVDALKQKIDIPFYWQDETLTTKLAANYQLRPNHPVDDHALAAAFILQDFLDTPEAERVVC